MTAKIVYDDGSFMIQLATYSGDIIDYYEVYTANHDFLDVFYSLEEAKQFIEYGDADAQLNMW